MNNLASVTNGTQASGWSFGVIERDGADRLMDELDHRDWTLEGVEVEGSGEVVARLAVELEDGESPFRSLEGWPVPVPLQEALARSFKSGGKVVRMKLDQADIDAIVDAFPAWAFV